MSPLIFSSLSRLHLPMFTLTIISNLAIAAAQPMPAQPYPGGADRQIAGTLVGVFLAFITIVASIMIVAFIAGLISMCLGTEEGEPNVSQWRPSRATYAEQARLLRERIAQLEAAEEVRVLWERVQQLEASQRNRDYGAMGTGAGPLGRGPNQKPPPPYSYAGDSEATCSQ
ncbi:hypothetical protein B0H13DRAFT_2013877 [Mycena leptocephala]|nr:hypothetical protein B0H13DRAFT_2013877 [Mycena leptocephala]